MFWKVINMYACILAYTIHVIAGLYSRKAFERLGFTINAEYFYKDYISEEGEQVFESIANHHRCTTLMTKKLLPIDKTIKEEPQIPSNSK